MVSPGNRSVMTVAQERGEETPQYDILQDNVDNSPLLTYLAAPSLMIFRASSSGLEGLLSSSDLKRHKR